MKPRSKAESYWRMLGAEFRQYIQKGTASAKNIRRFTRLQCNRAMRTQGKREIREGLDEFTLGGIK